MVDKQYTIEFADATGRPWKRCRISRGTLQKIQEKEKELSEQFDKETPTPIDDATGDETLNVTQNKLFDVRVASIVEYCADAEGKPLQVDELDVSEAQHLFQGFWRNVWGLDPKGNLL